MRYLTSKTAIHIYTLFFSYFLAGLLMYFLVRDPDSQSVNWNDAIKEALKFSLLLLSVWAIMVAIVWWPIDRKTLKEAFLTGEMKAGLNSSADLDTFADRLIRDFRISPLDIQRKGQTLLFEVPAGIRGSARFSARQADGKIWITAEKLHRDLLIWRPVYKWIKRLSA